MCVKCIWAQTPHSSRYGCIFCMLFILTMQNRQWMSHILLVLSLALSIYLAAVIRADMIGKCEWFHISFRLAACKARWFAEGFRKYIHLVFIALSERGKCSNSGKKTFIICTNLIRLKKLHLAKNCLTKCKRTIRSGLFQSASVSRKLAGTLNEET